MAGLFGLIGAAAGLAGDKPKVPDLPKIDVAEEQRKAIGNNTAALPDAQRLASGVNLFNQNELLGMLQRGIPGYQALQDQQSKTLMSMVRGELPDANRTATASAANAVGLGITDSKAANDLSMRDLGIASLAATQAGLSAADRWLRTTDAMTNPGLFNVNSMFVTPAQQLLADTAERDAQYNRQWTKNKLDAMPGPLEQQAMGIFDWMDSMGKGIAGGYLGNIAGAGNPSGGETLQDYGLNNPAGWGSLSNAQRNSIVSNVSAGRAAGKNYSGTVSPFE